MPCNGPKVPNRLSATAIDQRVAAQNGQYSAPMYSISGLPPDVSALPLIGLIGRFDAGSEPMPTDARVLAGTWVISCATAAVIGPLPSCGPGLVRLLMMSSATRIASTRPTEPVTMRILRRWSALAAAACCAAILWRAVRALFRSALAIGDVVPLPD